MSYPCPFTGIHAKNIELLLTFLRRLVSEVVFQGTPQEIIHCDRSKTGLYLKENIM